MNVKWADFLISKVKWKKDKLVESFFVHPDNIDTVGSSTERPRSWITNKLMSGKSFRTIQLNEDGKWINTSELRLENGNLKWNDTLPLILPRRKSFTSYYHKEDQNYMRRFDNVTSDLIVNKSVKAGDISTDVKDEYIKALIQKGHLQDTTLLIVLIGPNTKHRKHVDWEISGALNYKVGDSYSGLLGLKLPNHPDYGTGKHTYNLLPARLSDNLKSGYAIIRDYTTDRKSLQEYFEEAFEKRIRELDSKDNSRIQMKYNTC